MKSVAVVIPVNRQDLSKNELISIEQAFRVYKDRDIIFLTPDSLDYRTDYNAKIVKIDNKNFGTIERHNAMLLSEELYELFAEYEYILIYHVDAFVFNDDLDYFMNEGYDYVGAPWLYGVECENFGTKKTVFVGNGGFSLRKVSSFLSVVRSERKWIDLFKEPEDVFWGSIPYFKIPTASVALRFAVETMPQAGVLMNKGLPSGVHAWYKLDGSFWKKYIEQLGYAVDENDLHENERNCIMYELLLGMQHAKTSQEAQWFKDFAFEEIRPVVIWGAGERGRATKDIFDKVGIEVKCFVDLSPDKWDTDYAGTPIYNFSRKLLENSLILTAVAGRDEEIRRFVEEKGPTNCEVMSAVEYIYDKYLKFAEKKAMGGKEL